MLFQLTVFIVASVDFCSEDMFYTHALLHSLGRKLAILLQSRYELTTVPHLVPIELILFALLLVVSDAEMQGKPIFVFFVEESFLASARHGSPVN